jgi:hypothetical protein
VTVLGAGLAGLSTTRAVRRRDAGAHYGGRGGPRRARHRQQWPLHPAAAGIAPAGRDDTPRHPHMTGHAWLDTTDRLGDPPGRPTNARFEVDPVCTVDAIDHGRLIWRGLRRAAPVSTLSGRLWLAAAPLEPGTALPEAARAAVSGRPRAGRPGAEAEARGVRAAPARQRPSSGRPDRRLIAYQARRRGRVPARARRRDAGLLAGPARPSRAGRVRRAAITTHPRRKT